MSNLKKYPAIFIVIGLIGGILLTLGISKVMVKPTPNEKIKTDTSSVEESYNIKEEEKITPPSKETTPSVIKQETPPVYQAPPSTEEDAISYFEEQERMVLSKSSDTSILDKIKSGFKTMGNFLFNEGVIKGYTFKELTTTAKLKVVKLALSIDHKIDTYFPDYKENIKGAFNNLKAKAASLYIETTEKICAGDNASICAQAKEDFKTMKESFKISFLLIKDVVKSGINKVKDYFN